MVCLFPIPRLGLRADGMDSALPQPGPVLRESRAKGRALLHSPEL